MKQENFEKAQSIQKAIDILEDAVIKLNDNNTREFIIEDSNSMVFKSKIRPDGSFEFKIRHSDNSEIIKSDDMKQELRIITEVAITGFKNLIENKITRLKKEFEKL